jgi:hypothetical protein
VVGDRSPARQAGAWNTRGVTGGEIEHACEIVINNPPAHVFALLTDLE